MLASSNGQSPKMASDSIELGGWIKIQKVGVGD